jgi:mRNA interferase MazF
MIRRGEVWVANLNPNRGSEIGKVRPVLVMQADALTSIGNPMIVILPMSTQVYPTFKRWRITIPARDRLLKECQVLVDQPRALDRKYFGEGPITRLTPEEMAAVEKSVLAVIGI